MTYLVMSAYAGFRELHTFRDTIKTVIQFQALRSRAFTYNERTIIFPFFP